MQREGLYKRFPETPGVYVMRDARRRILYIGKAVNLRRRVSSYFTRPHDIRIERLVSEIKKIDFKKTDTALEALILEAELIKRHQPPYNILEKDDKSFLYVEITKEKFPRVLLVRGKDVEGRGLKNKNLWGPFVYGSAIKEALKLIRKIFPFSVHPPEAVQKLKRPCFDYQVELCPGVCVGAITREDYMRNIRSIKLIFRGKKKQLLSSLKKEMKLASKRLEFEEAAKLRRQIFALEHIRDIALIRQDDEIQNSKFKIQNSLTGLPVRIEGYDISNISGSSAVGSMVVFESGEPKKSDYRKFKIGTVIGANDVGMMEEVLRRRFNNNWPLPDLILVDGGLAQVNVAEAVLKERGLNIPVVGLAKGPERKRNDLVGKLPPGYDIKTLVRVRDEAHRFAISYHKQVRKQNFISRR